MSKSILFVGRFFSPYLLSIIKEDSKGQIGFSNHNFEMSIVQGLRRHEEIDVTAITRPSIFSFPHNSKTLFVKKESYKIDNIDVTSVGFVNLFFINKILSTLSLLIAIIRYYHKKEGNELNVIVNTVNVELLSAVLISKYFTRKRISVTLIIPDVPIMITNYNKQNLIKKCFVKFMDAYSMRLASKCNYYVLLTDEMKNFFRHPIRYIVVEGLIDENRYKIKNVSKEKDKVIILYTGTLNKYFGVINLIDAFELSDREKSELWICGSGDTQDEIIRRSRTNNKIKFLGLVNTEEVKELQLKADILVNPRGKAGEFTKYSFPSKNLEYMMTGNVVIINKLPGIPEEYYKYVICPKDESVESWAIAINNVLNMSFEERQHFGERSKDFVTKNKTAYVQVGKILDMLYNDCQS